MKIMNYSNTVLCKRLMLELLKEYNYYALSHLNVKKPAKWNESNMRALMSFIAKSEDLDDTIKYIKQNTYNKETNITTGFTSLLGKYSVGGFKSYHGINVSSIINSDGNFDDCLNKYESDEELEKYITESFSEDGIAYVSEGFSVPLPTLPQPEDFNPADEFAEPDEPTASPETNSDATSSNNEDTPVPTTIPNGMNEDKIKAELQKIAGKVLSGYQLVLQENAMEMLNQALEGKKQEIITEIEKVMLQNQLPPTVININTESYQIPGELHHEEFDTVLKLVANHVDLYLYSEAGIGKSHLVAQVAKALKLDLYIMLPGDAISLLGYEDAYGKFHETAFTKWARHGGILYGSEFDANDASLILNLNTALANGYTVINGETITLHKDCRFIADGNSKLTGATASYSGRQRQDSSIIDRLAFVEMKNDYKLELALSGNNKEWITFVKTFREQKKVQGSNMVVSLRATQMVLKLEKFLGTKTALEKGLLKGTNLQVTKAIADKLAIQLPQNKYVKALVEATRS